MNNETNMSEINNNSKLLFIGDYSFERTAEQLKRHFIVENDFFKVDDENELRTVDTMQLTYSKYLDGYLQEELSENIPFINYKSKLFSDRYDVIVLPLINDFTSGCYKRNQNNYYITCRGYWDCEEKIKKIYDDEELVYLQDNFTFVGKVPIRLFKDNLKKIHSSMGRTKLILINGVDIDISDQIGDERIRRNIEMNNAIDEFIKENPDVGLVDIRRIVTSREQLIEEDDRTFNNETYYRISDEIIKIFEKLSRKQNKSEVKENSRIEVLQKKINEIKQHGGCGVALEDAEELFVFHPTEISRQELLEDVKYKTIDNVDEIPIDYIKKNKGVKILIPDSCKSEKFLEYLIEFDDYMFEKYINKMITVIYGNCHTSVISQLLEQCEEFSEKYYLYPIKLIHTISTKEYFNEPIFRYCDLFIHQSIQLGNRYGEEFSSEKVIEKLKNECVVISIPNVYRLPICFFPQYSREEEFRRRNGNTVFFRDSVLDCMAEKGWGYNKIKKEYWKTDFEVEKLNEKLEDFFYKVKQRESEWDIKCFDYIKKMYRREKLFYDPNHPTNTFLTYVTEELLKILEVKYNRQDFIQHNVEALTGYEMPMLPCVKKNLELEFKDSSFLREGSLNKVKLGRMSQNDYILQYLSCEWQNKRVDRIRRCKWHLLWYLMKIYNLKFRFFDSAIT